MEKHMIYIWCASLKLTNQMELTTEQMLSLSGIYLYMIDKKQVSMTMLHCVELMVDEIHYFPKTNNVF